MDARWGTAGACEHSCVGATEIALLADQIVRLAIGSPWPDALSSALSQWHRRRTGKESIASVSLARGALRALDESEFTNVPGPDKEAAREAISEAIERVLSNGLAGLTDLGEAKIRELLLISIDPRLTDQWGDGARTYLEALAAAVSSQLAASAAGAASSETRTTDSGPVVPRLGQSIVVGRVPQLVDPYVHRPVELRLRSEIEATPRKSPFLLVGPAGSGKSQVAAWVFSQLLAGTPLRVWIAASSPDAIVRGYADAAQAMGLSTPPDSDPWTMSRYFTSWLAEIGDRVPWLLVLDDFIGSEMELGKFLPPSSPLGVVLVTSRNPREDFSATGNTIVNVPMFSTSEGIEFLRKAMVRDAGVAMSEAVLGAVVGALGGSPATLTLAAHLLTASTKTSLELMRRVDASRLAHEADVGTATS